MGRERDTIVQTHQPQSHTQPKLRITGQWAEALLKDAIEGLDKEEGAPPSWLEKLQGTAKKKKKKVNPYCQLPIPEWSPTQLTKQPPEVEGGIQGP